MYFAAVFLPPLAVLMCGKPFQALLNIPLCLLGGIPGMIHAVAVVAEYKSNERTSALVGAIRGPRRKRSTPEATDSSSNPFDFN